MPSKPRYGRPCRPEAEGRVALPESEFAAKAAGLAEQEKSSKVTNRHVAAILTPVPASLAELGKTLKAAGATRVENWVVARTLPPAV